jgi:hypothetical protein
VAKKNTSESENDPNISRNRAGAKSPAPRQSVTAASPSRSQSIGDAPIDTAADMKSAVSADSGNPGYGEIAEAAYHRYLRRGRQDGGDVDDWVEAERDLREHRPR